MVSKLSSSVKWIALLAAADSLLLLLYLVQL
jgi:hypothetical protein